MKPGDTSRIVIGSGYGNLDIRAVAMYNLERGSKDGKKYHPKEDGWNGYVLSLGTKRIYMAGYGIHTGNENPSRY